MSTNIPADRDILVCIFQRGAADGLNSVVPYGDTEYTNQRSNIAVPPPGMPNGAINLDGFFGLHPALAPLEPIYAANNLAIVHATGIPHGSRSHFAAQGLIERGVEDKSGPDTGWLGRHLSLSPPASTSLFRAVAINSNVPVTLMGATNPLAISELDSFSFDQGVIDAGYPELLNNLYGGTSSTNPNNTPARDVPFASTAMLALGALDQLNTADLNALTPNNGATYPTNGSGNLLPLASRLKQAGQLIYSNLPVEVICIDSDGWDHHENLPNALENSLSELALSLAAFHTDMGPQMQRITVLVQTEFGRRVKENASNGTDHGTGGVAYLIGGGVNGGQVFRNWPGLGDANLELGEDLKITTDLRTVLSELLNKRLGGADINAIFPDFLGPIDSNLFM